MRKLLALLLVFVLTAYVPLTASAARAEEFPAPAASQNQGQDYSYQLFSADQLDNLLAPIALYPDPLLAQVLLAATFPDQIDEADRELHANYDHYYVDSSYWDVSVKAVAHYPAVLHMMADRLDWTTSLGQAYVNQSTDVMEAVQRLRRESRNAGYLRTSRQMEVVETDGYIYLWPAQPRYIYVPVYDPAIVYYPRRGFFADAFIAFGSGFLIGAWLNNDCDWRERRVFYHGWDRDEGWERRSRPYVQVNNIYVNNTYVNVTVNRTVVDRNVNYNSLERYNSIHRDVHYDNVRANREQRGANSNRPVQQDNRPAQDDQRNRPNDSGQGQNNNNNGGNNKMIDRNMNTRDPRIDANRGRVTETPAQQNRPNTNQPPPNQPVYMKPPIRVIEKQTTPRQQDSREPQNRPNVNQPPTVDQSPRVRVNDNEPPQQQKDNRPAQNRPNTYQPPVNQSPPNRVVNQAPQRPPDRPNPPAYGGSRGQVDPGAASQRGQDSRTQPSRPPTPPPNRGEGGGQQGGAQQGGGNKPSGGDNKPKSNDKPKGERAKQE